MWSQLRLPEAEALHASEFAVVAKPFSKRQNHLLHACNQDATFVRSHSCIVDYQVYASSFQLATKKWNEEKKELYVVTNLLLTLDPERTLVWYFSTDVSSLYYVTIGHLDPTVELNLVPGWSLDASYVLVLVQLCISHFTAGMTPRYRPLRRKPDIEGC
jgi:hypothetical protein